MEACTLYDSRYDLTWYKNGEEPESFKSSASISDYDLVCVTSLVHCMNKKQCTGHFVEIA